MLTLLLLLLLLLLLQPVASPAKKNKTQKMEKKETQKKLQTTTRRRLSIFKCIFAWVFSGLGLYFAGSAAFGYPKDTPATANWPLATGH